MFFEEGRLKCHTCWILTSFCSKICNNSFVKIMFNEYKYVLCIKKAFELSFLLRQGQDFLLEIHNLHVTLLANTPRKVKDSKIAQVL